MKSKILISSIGYYFFLFILLAFLTSFLPISPIQNYQKILKFFVVLYYTNYRFYQRILENLWIFIEKNRDIWNTKHFQNSIVDYLLFNFIVFLTSFFLFYLPIVVIKFLKFCGFYCMDPRFYQRILQNYGFFFKKIWCIWNPKFHQNSIIYYFFLIFLAFLTSFFSIQPIQSCQKIIEFFVVFCWKDWRFYQRILKISRSSFKKIYICEIFFVVKFLALVFFYFFSFLTFSFLFHLFVRVKKFSKCSCSFILWIRDFIKEF